MTRTSAGGGAQPQACTQAGTVKRPGDDYRLHCPDPVNTAPVRVARPLSRAIKARGRCVGCSQNGAHTCLEHGDRCVHQQSARTPQRCQASGGTHSRAAAPCIGSKIWAPPLQQHPAQGCHRLSAPRVPQGPALWPWGSAPSAAPCGRPTQPATASPARAAGPAGRPASQP